MRKFHRRAVLRAQVCLLTIFPFFFQTLQMAHVGTDALSLWAGRSRYSLFTPVYSLQNSNRTDYLPTASRQEATILQQQGKYSEICASSLGPYASDIFCYTPVSSIALQWILRWMF